MEVLITATSFVLAGVSLFFASAATSFLSSAATRLMTRKVAPKNQPRNLFMRREYRSAGQRCHALVNLLESGGKRSATPFFALRNIVPGRRRAASTLRSATALQVSRDQANGLALLNGFQHREREQHARARFFIRERMLRVTAQELQPCRHLF